MIHQNMRILEAMLKFLHADDNDDKPVISIAQLFLRNRQAKNKISHPTWHTVWCMDLSDQSYSVQEGIRDCLIVVGGL